MSKSVQVGPNPRLIGGGGGGGTAGGYYNVVMDGSKHFTLDLALCGGNLGSFRIVLDTTTATGTPPTTIATILMPIWTGGSIVANTSFALYIDEDDTVANGGTGGYWPVPNFVLGAGGFASDVPNQGISGIPNTRSAYIFTFHGTIWGLDSFRANCAIS